jgi:hypothetical protein
MPKTEFRSCYPKRFGDPWIIITPRVIFCRGANQGANHRFCFRDPGLRVLSRFWFDCNVNALLVRAHGAHLTVCSSKIGCTFAWLIRCFDCELQVKDALASSTGIGAGSEHRQCYELARCVPGVRWPLYDRILLFMDTQTTWQAGVRGFSGLE